MKNQGDGSIFRNSRAGLNLPYYKREPSPLLSLRGGRSPTKQSRSNRIGQSILELAILGTILIGILGLVVSYGLRYNYQQKVTMQAFRNAYNATSEGGSYTLVVDKHLPNPSDPWGVGSITPVSASANINRTYHGQDAAACDADDLSACSTADLPETTIEIKGSNGSFKRSFTIVGFRDVSWLTPEQIDKYEEIYGASNVCSDPKQGCGAREGECIKWTINPQTGEKECTGKKYVKIRILDPCEGEFVSADMLRRICYLINNTAACKKDCARGGKGDCSSCDQSIPSPWYCSAEAVLFPPDKFPAKIKSMGIGINYGQTINSNNTLTKSGNSVTDQLDWNVQTNRKIFYKSGQGVVTIDVPTEVSQRDNWNWQ
jgi:hypothetical protein